MWWVVQTRIKKAPVSAEASILAVFSVLHIRDQWRRLLLLLVLGNGLGHWWWSREIALLMGRGMFLPC